MTKELLISRIEEEIARLESIEYDNSILYTDYILSSIIEHINRPNTVSAFMFVSDHGEEIAKGGAGHGGNCTPTIQE